MIILTALLLFTFVSSPPDITKSIVRLTQPGNVCTGVVVRPTQVLSAEHCIDGTALTVDGMEAKVIKRSGTLILVDVPGLLKPGLSIGKLPRRGDEVFSWGYAYDLGLTVLVRHIANFLDEDIMLDGTMAKGMSGGPVVNQRGELVGINQGTDAMSYATSIMCGPNEIREFLK